MIEKIIHQFWDTPSVPADVADAMRTWREQNPEFRYILWNDETAADFLSRHFGRDTAACFRACSLPAMRADLFRVAVLYALGGFYVDADEACQRSIEPLAARECDAFFHLLKNEATANPRLRNHFMAARQGCFFLGRLTVHIIKNILENKAEGVIDMTGPGALTRCYYQGRWFHSNERVDFLERPDLGAFMRHRHGLAYKARGEHWFTQQDTSALVDVAVLEAAARLGAEWVDTVFLGHPRCGPRILLTALRKAGLEIGADQPAADAMVSWRLAGEIIRAGAVRSGRVAVTGERKRLFMGRVIHFLRDPDLAIPDTVAHWTANGREGNEYRHHSAVLSRKFGIDLGELDLPVAAATSYALWNDLAGQHADHRLMIEAPGFRTIFPGLRSEILLAIPQPEHVRPEIDLSALLARMPAAAAESLRAYLDLYAPWRSS